MTRGQSRVARVALALAFFAVLFVRAPAIWLEGRFFADEADYFEFAWHARPVEALLSPQLGYWALWTNLGTTIGAHVLPLELAPLACVAFGTAALAAVVWTLLRAGGPLPSVAAQGLALMLVLVVPPGYGRTNVTFAHFWFALAAAILLVSDERRGPRGARTLLVLAGASGAVATFLTPLFALRALRDRSRERALQAALLGSAGLFQLVVHLLAGGRHAARFVAPEPDVLAASLVNHVLVHPLAGRAAMIELGQRVGRHLAAADAATTTLVALACALILGAAGWAVGRAPRSAPDAAPGVATDEPEAARTPAWLVGAALFLAVPSLLAGTPCGDAPTKLCYLTGQFRYFAVPSALVALAVLARARAAPPGPRRAVFRALTLALLVLGARSFVVDTPAAQLDGPSWRAEVAAWRRNPAHRLRVWPERWPPLDLEPR